MELVLGPFGDMRHVVTLFIDIQAISNFLYWFYSVPLLRFFIYLFTLGYSFETNCQYEKYHKKLMPNMTECVIFFAYGDVISAVMFIPACPYSIRIDMK